MSPKIEPVPNRPLGKCSQPGCPNRTADAGRCEQHRRQADRDAKARQTWRWVYDDPRWDPLRTQVLLEQPVCAVDGCDSPTAAVDHIFEVRTHPLLAFNRRNLQGLCWPHHSSKTATANSFGGTQQ